jgi:hypothetical protein
MVIEMERMDSYGLTSLYGDGLESSDEQESHHEQRAEGQSISLQT